MPARDTIHDPVVAALVNEGWEITDDPFTMRYGERGLFVDLGALDERPVLLGLRRNERRIAVEVKSFHSLSPVDDLKTAVGAYLVYDCVMQEVDPARVLYLAIKQPVFEDFFQEPIAQLVVDRLALKLLVVDCDRERIVQWIPPIVTP
jgi:hypothetical protein